MTDVDVSDFARQNFLDDALSVRRDLVEEIEHKGKEVVVVMHSYGGLVDCEAIPEDLS